MRCRVVITAADALAVTGVGPPDVGADRAAQAERVARVAEVVDLRAVAADGRVRAVGGEGQRRAVGPSADDLRSQRVGATGVAGGVAGHERPEPGDVLVQLAVDDVGAVAAERAGRRLRQDGIRVAVAEEQLAGGDRVPGAPPADGAVHRSTLERALDGRLGEAVEEAEVLAGLEEPVSSLVVDDVQVRVGVGSG